VVTEPGSRLPTAFQRLPDYPQNLTHYTMGIILPTREMEIIPLTGGISIQIPQLIFAKLVWPGYSPTPGSSSKLQFN